MSMTDTAEERQRFERLFACHHRLLVRFLTRMTHCPQRAEDLAQVSWLKLISARERGACAAGSDGELRAYLFTIARNAFLDEYTRKHEAMRTRPVDPCVLDAMQSGLQDEGPEQEIDRHQRALRLRQAVARLPAEQQKVIGMWSQGASIREMAAACAAPTDTVLSRKKYAVARLRGAFAAAAMA